jgi:hypothetical protein
MAHSVHNRDLAGSDLQPWPVFSTYLNAYVLLFICEEGWFFSTSTDLVTWTTPKQYFTAPVREFTTGQPTDENIIMVTPGNPGQVIGQTGYVLYAHTPAWGDSAHELWMRPFTFNSSSTDVHPSDGVTPSSFELSQNYPNPFNPTTSISYQLPVASNVRLVVYDVLGREVAVLVNETRPGGRYMVQFDASGLSSGVYLCRLTAGSFTRTLMMLLLK